MNTRKSILLVEDNPDDVLLTKRAFKKKNIRNQLIVAEDGPEALDMLYGEEASQTVKPELILLDLKLPRMDGLQVLQRIKSEESTKHVPVVVLTTSSEDRDINKSYDLGANSYILKPVNFETFLNAVGQLGEYWLSLNQAKSVLTE